MGEHSRFHEGQKSPKNAVYMEIGESGASVQDPMIIELSKGEKFPATRNKNRVWTQNSWEEQHVPCCQDCLQRKTLVDFTGQRNKLFSHSPVYGGS